MFAQPTVVLKISVYVISIKRAVQKYWSEISAYEKEKFLADCPIVVYFDSKLSLIEHKKKELLFLFLFNIQKPIRSSKGC